MNITPINNNSVNFQAKLDISNITENKTRWQNIAKEFEKQTKEYPNDTLEIQGNFNEGFEFTRTKNGKSLAFIDSSFIDINFSKVLGKLKDSEIAEKLKQLFRIQKATDILNKRADAFMTKYLPEKYASEEDRDCFCDAWAACNKTLTERMLKKDELLYKNKRSIQIN